jgi:hypothetical protein
MLLNLQVVQIRMYERNTSYLISKLQFYTSINFYHTSQKAQYKSNFHKEERLGNVNSSNALLAYHKRNGVELSLTNHPKKRTKVSKTYMTLGSFHDLPKFCT